MLVQEAGRVDTGVGHRVELLELERELRSKNHAVAASRLRPARLSEPAAHHHAGRNCPARRSHIAAAHRCLFGVALSWPAVLSGTARGVAGKGFVPLEVAVPSLLTTSPAQSRRDAVGVIIRMDPHKNSATIEVVDERGRVLPGGRYGTDKAGYADMLRAGRRFTDRVWAVEGCNGIGRHIAHRLVHDGETVLDVPAKLSAQVRVFATGNGRKSDPVDAHSVAMGGWRCGWST